jgi:hypothetical protein
MEGGEGGAAGSRRKGEEGAGRRMSQGKAEHEGGSMDAGGRRLPIRDGANTPPPGRPTHPLTDTPHMHHPQHHPHSGTALHTQAHPTHPGAPRPSPSPSAHAGRTGPCPGRSPPAACPPGRSGWRASARSSSADGPRGCPGWPPPGAGGVGVGVCVGGGGVGGVGRGGGGTGGRR